MMAADATNADLEHSTAVPRADRGPGGRFRARTLEWFRTGEELEEKSQQTAFAGEYLDDVSRGRLVALHAGAIGACMAACLGVIWLLA